MRIYLNHWVKWKKWPSSGCRIATGTGHMKAWIIFRRSFTGSNWKTLIRTVSDKEKWAILISMDEDLWKWMRLFPRYLHIAHTQTKTISPQTNGICECIYKTILQIMFHKKLYADLESLQIDPGNWLLHYNNERTHQGKMRCGPTPMVVLLDRKRSGAEKSLNRI